MKTVSSIDWLTITINDTPSPQLILPLGNIELYEQAKPPAHFDIAWKLYPAGFFAATNGAKAMGMLRLTGSDLVDWRSIGMSDTRIMEYMRCNGGQASRLDFAVDVFDTNANPQQLIDLFNEGLARTRVRTVHPIGTVENGLTVYFGSKSSERMVRAYDKAKEQKIEGERWTRIELQARKGRAAALYRDMNRHGIRKAGKNAIIDLIDFPALWWWCNAVGGEDSIGLERIPRKRSKIMTWLETQVLPAMLKDRSCDEVSEIRSWLVRAAIALRDKNGGC